MQTYQEFLDRINSFQKKELDFGKKYFKGNPSIAKKVDKNNAFRKFYGDTVVFALDEKVKEKLAEYTEVLYQSVPECFSERLIPDAFHVTLHDLASSPELRDVAEELFMNELRIIEKAEELREFEKAKIRMQSKYIFNMVDTSLVLGLYPADEEDYQKLMDLYYIFDNIKSLYYPFTPHITLAYYSIHGFDAQTAARLAETVGRLNENSMEIELNVNNLYYQKFRSMNDYVNVINLGVMDCLIPEEAVKASE